MFKTLRNKILFYLLIVSLCGILLTSFSVIWGIENHFTDYLNENKEKNIHVIEDMVLKEYKESGNLINNPILGLMHEHAMTENLFYQIVDKDDQLVADSREMHGMMEGMNRAYGDDYKTTTYPLRVAHQNIGSLIVFYPNKILGEDYNFIKTIKQNIYIAATVTVILSLLFSMLFSKKLTAGFQKLSKAVRELQAHNWSVRVPVHELTDEMKHLGASFNSLAESLSKEEIIRKQFTADLAHELRTPLATLRSQIEAYQDGIWEPTPKRLEQSHDELMRLVRLVNEMEKLLAAENPQIKLEKTNIEAGKILALIETQFQPAFLGKGVHLTVRKPKKEYWFQGDMDRVIQILQNIVNNAFQYTPTGKHVTIEMIDRENTIGFVVKDEGIGIDKESIPYVFERFYRGDKSRGRKTGGIGIGLSIVKALVDAHEGDINIESTIGIGTTVTVSLPK